MLSLFVRIQDTIKNLHRQEEAQDAFEYLLVIGAVMVAIVIAAATGGLDALVDGVIGGVEAAINTVGISTT